MDGGCRRDGGGFVWCDERDVWVEKSVVPVYSVGTTVNGSSSGTGVFTLVTYMYVVHTCMYVHQEKHCSRH